jgi:hypothetical protein
MSKTMKECFLHLYSRYGRTGTLALVLATVAMAVIPVPGLVFVPVCIAEWARKTKTRNTPSRPFARAPGLLFPWQRIKRSLVRQLASFNQALQSCLCLLRLGCRRRSLGQTFQERLSIPVADLF